MKFQQFKTTDQKKILKSQLKNLKESLNVQEKTRKNTTFSIPIEKNPENDKTVIYKIKFIDSARFMAISLSSLADNLAEGIHNSKWHDCKSCL